ncbi:dipeptide/oligopeptide/nickel ABC transporter permease/ATP-binding protein [Isoptericola sp. NPDC019482]|uniref:dipeptide/oligopeptide/nickel ABC transporter permease/ATP-binding protein n=1 Tax=Isoptericola sp. NPDC019482 TaxID=3154688 RepID=UPI0034945174
MSNAVILDPADRSPAGAQARGVAQAWHRLRRQPSTLFAVVVVAVLVVVAVAAPLLAPYAPEATDFDAPLSGPTADHPLGTADLGQDLLSQLIYGARTALVVAGGSVLVAMLIGVPIGLVLGYKGGWYDRIGSRGLDIADALPGLMVGFVVIAILGRGMAVLVLAIGLVFCMNFARMTRAITLTERKKLYVESAHVSGLRERQIVFGQVLPNLAGPLAVQAAVFLGSAIKVEAALSFLGLGLGDDQPSWGGMLGVAAEHQADQPLMAVAPGIAILLTVLAFNLLGDGINDALSGRRTTGRRRTALLGRQRPPASPTLAEVRAAASAADGTADVAAVDAPPVATAPVGPGRAAADGDADDDRSDAAVLDVRDATIVADRPDGSTVTLVHGVSLRVRRGEILGLLGESGSGKSMLAKAVLGLLPPGVRLTGGSIRLNGTELAGCSERELRAVRGTGLGVVLQNPQANLSPVHTVGRQLVDVLRAHHPLSRRDARARAAELLDLVGVNDVQRRLDQYPYQFSGGMAQRVAIAIALAGEPDLLILDEATSALDVTTQSQVLDLVLDLRDRLGMAIVNITHDLGVAAETCDRVAVLYRGELVEVADVVDLFDRPQQPYTAALLAAHPTADADIDTHDTHHDSHHDSHHDAEVTA